jgi:hypothetical protein
MSGGRGDEYDHPYKLLVANVGDDKITRDGLFAKMIKATGPDTANILLEISK